MTTYIYLSISIYLSIYLSFFLSLPVLQGGDDLREHSWELEEQLARLLPVINLVDNMVKLGTLYRGNNSNNNNNNNNKRNNNINKVQVVISLNLRHSSTISIRTRFLFQNYMVALYTLELLISNKQCFVNYLAAKKVDICVS